MRRVQDRRYLMARITGVLEGRANLERRDGWDGLLIGNHRRGDPWLCDPDRTFETREHPFNPRQDALSICIVWRERRYFPAEDQCLIARATEATMKINRSRVVPAKSLGRYPNHRTQDRTPRGSGRSGLQGTRRRPDVRV